MIIFFFFSRKQQEHFFYSNYSMYTRNILLVLDSATELKKLFAMLSLFIFYLLT